MIRIYRTLPPLLFAVATIQLTSSQQCDLPICEPCCFCIPDKKGGCPSNLGNRLTANQYYGSGLFLDFKRIGDEFSTYEYTLDCQPFPDLDDLGPSCDDGDQDDGNDCGQEAECVFVYDVSLCEVRTETVCPEDDDNDGNDNGNQGNEIVVTTHKGRCGACSSPQDLAVNMSPILSIGSSVCAMLGLPYDLYNHEQFERAENCFLGLGFTPECAFLWASNGANSARNGCTYDCVELFGICRDKSSCYPHLGVGEPCVGIVYPPVWPDNLGCLPFLPGSFNTQQCDLRPCLDCDESESGRVFQRYSGRTARNSGIVTSYQSPPGGAWIGLKRDCKSIADIRQEVPDAFKSQCF